MYSLISSQVHSSLGDVYKDMGEFDKAIIEFQASLRIRDTLGSSVKGILGSGSNSNALADIYEMRGVSGHCSIVFIRNDPCMTLYDYEAVW